MSEAVVIALIAAGLPTLLAAIGALATVLWRWWRRRRIEQAKARKAVASLERALERRNIQIASLKELVDRLERERDRIGETLERQDRRIERKDARIAHLEALLDKRGSA